MAVIWASGKVLKLREPGDDFGLLARPFLGFVFLLGQGGIALTFAKMHQPGLPRPFHQQGR